MQFKYIASQPDGRIVENEVDVKDLAEVLHFLSSQGLKPISVQPLEGKGIAVRRIFRSSINLTDQIFLSKYLALMLKIGTGLLQAINILIEDFDKQSVKAFLLEIRSNVEKGNPFYLTFARYPKIFSQVYINMIKAGEASGNLEKIFNDLTEILTKQKNLKDQIRGALIYPAILFVGSILVMIFLITFALPKIAKVFTEGGFETSFFSKVVFAVSLFFGKYIFVILGVLIVLFILAFYLYKTSLEFRKFILSLISEIPVVKDIVKKVALQRFASILSSLIKAGLPITEGLEITAQAVGSVELKESLIRVSREGLSRGLTIGEAFRKQPYYPRTVVNLMAISEKAGHIEDVLATLSDFYTKEIDGSLKMLVSFLEPALLLFIGVVIGVIALSIIVPIYQLTTQF
jgi:type II secretory pathway component PulF